jgi:organic hydroperoxide reductase OsmC/OhrA
VTAQGALERHERVTAFTAFSLRARLVVAAGVDAATARAALERAEHGCLVSNSLKAPVALESEVAFAS